jgi:two-component system NtrC family sensor kinase
MKVEPGPLNADHGARYIGNRQGRTVDRKSFVGTTGTSRPEPIDDFGHHRIGISTWDLERNADIKTEVQVVFLGITILGALVTMVFAYRISQNISTPVRKLVAASREVADGNFNARVKIQTGDELGTLADSFNRMAAALQDREAELQEFTKTKIMESERLALIGQLAAGVAHELNNPLQGIVTYSHLLLESMPADEPCRPNLEKIVTQAGRCGDIVRGLLDFSRQRKSNKTLYDVNKVLRQCISLLENQAIFQNIEMQKSMAADLPLTCWIRRSSNAHSCIILNAVMPWTARQCGTTCLRPCAGD